MSRSSYRPDSRPHLSQMHAALPFRGCEGLIDVSDRFRLSVSKSVTDACTHRWAEASWPFATRSKQCAI